MSFTLKFFTVPPSQELLDLANITDLYGLPNVKKTMLKHELKNILIQFIVEEEIFDSSTTCQTLVTQTDFAVERIRN